MANPTLAKPTGYFSEKVQTAGTVGELMRCQLPLLASGVPRCPFLNLLAEPQISRSGGGTGHGPVVDPAGFDAGGLSDVSYRFTAGTFALRVTGAGWPALPTNPRTMFAVIKPLSCAGAATRTVQVLTNGTDTGFYGFGYQISTSGVITLGSLIGTTFTTSGITLTSGKWYLISLTYTSTTSRSWNVYNFTDQAWVTSSSASTVTTEGAYSTTGPVQNDLVFNAQNSVDSYQINGFIGSLYTCGFTDASMAISANAYFAALIADPVVACRGTNAGGGALTAGGIVNYDATESQIIIHANRPSGGTPGGYQFRLHRSVDGAFVPSAATRVTSLQSSPRLVDLTAEKEVSYWYRAEFFDGTSTVYSTTATSNKSQTPGRLSRGDFFFGIAGDSRYASTGLASAINICFALRAMNFRAGVANGSLGGTLVNSATASVSWQPNTTQDPVNGQAGTTLLANLISLMDISEVTDVLIEIGVNDCNGSIPAATTLAKLQIITDYLISQGKRCILLRPYIQTSGDEDHEATTQEYGELLRTLDNGSTIIVATDTSFNLSMSAHEALTRDYLHYNFSNLEGLAAAQAIVQGLGLDIPTAALAVVDLRDGSGGSGTITSSGDSARNIVKVYSTAGDLISTFDQIGDGTFAMPLSAGDYLAVLSVDGMATSPVFFSILSDSTEGEGGGGGGSSGGGGITLPTRGQWLLSAAIIKRWQDSTLESQFRNAWSDPERRDALPFNDTEARPVKKHPRPYVVFEEREPISIGNSSGRTADTKIKYLDCPVDFKVYGSTKAEAAKYAEYLAGLFAENRPLTISGDRQIQILADPDMPIREDDGTWFWLLQFRFRIEGDVPAV